jgi:hypothetical protein
MENHDWEKNGNVSDPFGLFGSVEKNKSSHCKMVLSRIFPFLVLIFSQFSFFLLQLKKIGLPQPVIPIELGLVKDILDVFVVIIFPWHGWVVMLPLLAGVFVREGNVKLFIIFILSSILTALIASVFNYNELTSKKIFVVIITYGAINTTVLVMVVLSRVLFRRIK